MYYYNSVTRELLWGRPTQTVSTDTFINLTRLARVCDLFLNKDHKFTKTRMCRPIYHPTKELYWFTPGTENNLKYLDKVISVLEPNEELQAAVQQYMLKHVKKAARIGNLIMPCWKLDEFSKMIKRIDKIKKDVTKKLYDKSSGGTSSVYIKTEDPPETGYWGNYRSWLSKWEVAALKERIAMIGAEKKERSLRSSYYGYSTPDYQKYKKILNELEQRLS